jgi:hypothetical protein
MLNRSLQGISGLMEPRITALRKVENVQRFDPLLTKSVWWNNRMGDDTLQTRGYAQQMNQSGLIGYGRRKKRHMSMPPPAVNLEKRYKLQGGRGLRQGGGGMNGQGLRMAGQGLRMAGQGLPIRLSNAQSINYM